MEKRGHKIEIDTAWQVRLCEIQCPNNSEKQILHMSQGIRSTFQVSNSKQQIKSYGYNCSWCILNHAFMVSELLWNSSASLCHHMMFHLLYARNGTSTKLYIIFTFTHAMPHNFQLSILLPELISSSKHKFTVSHSVISFTLSVLRNSPASQVHKK